MIVSETKPNRDEPEASCSGSSRGAARRGSTQSRFLRARAFILGAVALGLAGFAQMLMVKNGVKGVDGATNWYALAILALILGWHRTDKNRKSVLGLGFLGPADCPRSTEEKAPQGGRRGLALRAAPWLLALAAVALSAASTWNLRAHNYDSVMGASGWAVALLLLLVAAVLWDIRHKSRAVMPEKRIERNPKHQRWLEGVLFIAIVGLAVAFRLYRLGDWTTGMHGDEGEVGMDALRILSGHPTPPFRTGWFGQPNFYYWSVALVMKFFGTGLTGLRMFSALSGIVLVVFFYFLVRDCFGRRMAIISGFFLAMSDVAVHFSRQEFSNITTPLFMAAGFLFFLRGLRTGRYWHFVMAAYFHMLNLHFYLGGRISPLLMGAFGGYLFLIRPLVVGRRRGSFPRFTALRHYRAHIAIFAIAAGCFAAPWTAFYMDHLTLWNSRLKAKLIFQHPEVMVAQHHVTHDPLFLVIRGPFEDGGLQAPIVFEPTDLSVKLAEDGFWPRAIWAQLTTSLSILTYRHDASSVYTFTREPVAKPMEAALIILGIAWALWCWRNGAMALLSIWFWGPVFIGGTLTINAPYMARLIPILPMMAVFAALPLDKLATELERLLVGRNGSKRLAFAGKALTSVAIAGILGFLLWQNVHDYFYRYLESYPFRPTTGQAVFVRQIRERIEGEGRPPPKFFAIGSPKIYWTHGVNRFLNAGTDGEDVRNLADLLPIREDEDRDVIFFLWPHNKQYLPILRLYYPDGDEKVFRYGAPGRETPLLTSYLVRKEEIAAHRQLKATYRMADGSVLQRMESGFGTTKPLPIGTVYPVEASWSGTILAPTYSSYRFMLRSEKRGELTIDGRLVVRTGEERPAASGKIVLSRGLHAVELRGFLRQPAAKVSIQWGRGFNKWQPVDKKVLWTGPNATFAGTVWHLPSRTEPDLADLPSAASRPLLSRRGDGFLGMHAAPTSMSRNLPLIASWRSRFDVPKAGAYRFSAYSNGGSMILIDGETVVDNRHPPGPPRRATGQITLEPGEHTFELRYVWTRGFGILEASWAPPGGALRLIAPGDMQPDPAKISVELDRRGAEASTAGVRPLDEAPPMGDIVPHTMALQGSRSMAAGPDSRLYVADTKRRRLVVLDTDGKLVAAFGEDKDGSQRFEIIEDISIGPAGRIYILDSARRQVLVCDVSGVCSTLIDGGRELCNPAGFDVGKEGHVFIADTCQGRVRHYDAAGKWVRDYRANANPQDRIEQPIDVAVDDKNVYVADLKKRIVKLDRETGLLEKVWPIPVGVFNGGSSLEIAGSKLYLNNANQNSLFELDMEIDDVHSIGRRGQFTQPVGIAATGSKLFILEGKTGRIQRLDRTPEELPHR